jgi:RING finger protein 113A
MNKKRAEKDDVDVEDDQPGVEIEGLVDDRSRDSDSGDDDND